MKKIYALIIMLTALSVSAFVLIGKDAYSERDKVVITEKTIYGDKTIVNDIELVIRNQFRAHLFWETTCRLEQGENVKSETQYSFFAIKNQERNERKNEGVVISNDIRYGDTTHHYYGEQINSNDAVGLDKAINELRDHTLPGTTKSKTVYLKDYYTYYPIRVMFDLGDMYWEADMVGYGDENVMYSISEEFKEFFKIPVLETDSVTISVTKYEELSNGMNFSTDSIGSSDYEYYTIDNVCVIGEETCYFNISNKKTVNNKTVEYVDMSLVPGGYGIYTFSYKKDNGLEEIVPNSLKMVVPLEMETVVSAMTLNEEDSKLLVFTDEKENAYVRIIDIETMKEVQKIKLNNKNREYRMYVYEYDNFVVAARGKKVTILSLEDGTYTYEFTIDGNTTLGDKFFYINSNSEMDFDGEKLAIVTEVNDGYVGGMCKVYVIIYDETGMLYWGEYGNSLLCNSNLDYYNCCVLTERNPYKIYWQ